nr:TetR/AcrR family transcriptional regulator [uncultured Dyadobacter sp.]
MARPKKFDETAALQKALHIFWKKGYTGTSMSDLTKSMEINAPSLYDTYGDKRQLFLTALKYYVRSQHEWMHHALDEDKPVKEIVKMLLTSLLDETLTDPERRGCFIVNTVTELANQDQQVFEVASENENLVRGMLGELIRKGQANGEISAEKDPGILATYLFINFMGIRVIAATNSNRKHLESALEVVVSAL